MVEGGGDLAGHLGPRAEAARIGVKDRRDARRNRDVGAGGGDRVREPDNRACGQTDGRRGVRPLDIPSPQAAKKARRRPPFRQHAIARQKGQRPLHAERTAGRAAESSCATFIPVWRCWARSCRRVQPQGDGAPAESRISRPGPDLPREVAPLSTRLDAPLDARDAEPDKAGLRRPCAWAQIPAAGAGRRDCAPAPAPARPDRHRRARCR